jgi:hypothetical protein
MPSLRHFRTTILLVCIAAAGCATNRSEISIDSPIATPPASSGQAIVIRSVTDVRIFEEAPPDPSTPSLGFGGAGAASAEIKSRAVARKRNSFGQALGDVLLQPGQSVEGLVRQNLAEALAEAGYQVVTEAAAGPSPLVVDVRIRKFWAWTQPGFWAITLAANISTDLEVQGAASPTTIDIHKRDTWQAATDGAWAEIVSMALAAYRAEVIGNAKTLSAGR